jgi:hypothetical protein
MSEDQDRQNVMKVVFHITSLFIEDPSLTWFPQGPAYMALNSHGITLDQFMSAIHILGELGVVSYTSEIVTFLNPKDGHGHRLIVAITGELAKTKAAAQAEMN